VLVLCERNVRFLYKGWNTPRVFLLYSFNSLLIKKKQMRLYSHIYISLIYKCVLIKYDSIATIKNVK